METLSTILGMLPTFVIAVLALTLLLLNLFKSEIPKISIIVLFSLFALYFAVLGLGITDNDTGGGIVFNADALAFTFCFILIVSYFLCACLGDKQLKNQEAKNAVDADVLMALAVCGAMAMISAANFVMVFIGLEIMSLAVYALSGVARKEKASAEASWKCFLSGAFASAFVIFGFAMIYGVTGSLDIASHQPQGSALLYAAFGLVIFGFALKVGLAPFHYWVPNVYQGAPTTITAFMSVMLKGAVLVVLFRMLGGCFSEISNVWVIVLGVLSVLSMFVGNVLALKQDSVKKMLAYSCIAHAGYMFMSLAVLDADALSHEAVSFYLFSYALAIIGAFAVVLIVTGGTANQYDRDSISSFRGLGWKSPWIGIAMTLFLLSLTGIPPLAGFIGKLYVFEAVIGAEKSALAVLAAINVVIAAYYYLRVVAVMYSGKSGGKGSNAVGKNVAAKVPEQNAVLQVSGAPKFVLVVASVAVIVFGISASSFTYVSQFKKNVLGISQISDFDFGGGRTFRLSR